MRGHTDSLTAVAFGTLSDGRLLLASGSDDRTVRLWEASRRRSLGLIPTLEAPRALAFGNAENGQPSTLLAIGTEAALLVTELQPAIDDRTVVPET